MKKTLKFLFSIVVVSSLAISPAFALVDVNDDIDTQSVASALSDAVLEKASTMDAYSERITAAFTTRINDLKAHFIIADTERGNSERLPMPFYALINGLTSERVFSEYGAQQVNKRIEEIKNAALAGHKTIADVTDGSSDNPMSATTSVEMDAIIAKKLDEVFCTPESKLATDDCAAKMKEAGVRPGENFVDMFLGNGTWSSNTIYDSMLLARRFFSNAFSYIDVSNQASNSSSFMDNQAQLARDNVRLAIFDNLAARRAPTSNATYNALQTLLMILAPSNQITSLDYKRICANANANFMERYVCTLTGDPMDGAVAGQRAISQTALDKILQHDLMLSPNMYNEINSPANKATGSIEKLEVFLKAQQVAQDYRQLQLLQMKVATTAMNLINR